MTSNAVTIYYGLADAGQVAGDWNESLSLGSKNQGVFDVHLQGLDRGKPIITGSRVIIPKLRGPQQDLSLLLRFDQGIVRINTGMDDYGANAGIFWDRNNGGGRTKNIRGKYVYGKLPLPLMDLPGKPQRQFLQ